MADCKFIMHIRGTKDGAAELLARLTDWKHVPHVYRPVWGETVMLVGVERDDDGRELLSYVVDGTCSCSVEGSMCSDSDMVGIRSVGWGGTLAWVSGPKHEGEVTLEACTTELGVDIEAYSYDVDDDETIWEHVWYSADGQVAICEDNERYDEWGAMLDPVVIPLEWHV